MPINAGPEYFKAEAKYNAAKTIPEKIAGLEEMLRVGPNHKSTENLRAEIKTKIAKLRAQLEKERITAKGKGKGANLTIKREDRKSTRLNSSHSQISYSVFFFNDTATTEIYTLSLHDALPICKASRPIRKRTHNCKRKRQRSKPYNQTGRCSTSYSSLSNKCWQISSIISDNKCKTYSGDNGL